LGTFVIAGCIHRGILDCYLSRRTHGNRAFVGYVCRIDCDRLWCDALSVPFLGRNSDSNVRGNLLFTIPLDEEFSRYLLVSFYRKSQRSLLDKTAGTRAGLDGGRGPCPSLFEGGDFGSVSSVRSPASTTIFEQNSTSRYPVFRRAVSTARPRA
jgi:hypothetical protein